MLSFTSSDQYIATIVALILFVALCYLSERLLTDIIKGASVAVFQARQLVRAIRRKLRKKPTKPAIVGIPRTFQRAYAFVVFVDGFRWKAFSKVEGLDWRRNMEGKNVYGRITLSRGLVNFGADGGEMQEWYVAGTPRAVSIEFLDRDGRPVSHVYLGQRTPVAYRLSDPDNSIDQNIIESIELASLETDKIEAIASTICSAAPTAPVG